MSERSQVERKDRERDFHTDTRLFRRWPRTGRYAWMAAISLADPR